MPIAPKYAILGHLVCSASNPTEALGVGFSCGVSVLLTCSPKMWPH
jgi:hypothetical protein